MHSRPRFTAWPDMTRDAGSKPASARRSSSKSRAPPTIFTTHANGIQVRMFMNLDEMERIRRSPNQSEAYATLRSEYYFPTAKRDSQPAPEQVPMLDRKRLGAWLKDMPTFEQVHPRRRWRRGVREARAAQRLTWLHLEEYAMRFEHRSKSRRSVDTSKQASATDIFWISHNDHPIGFDTSTSKAMRLRPALIPTALFLQQLKVYETTKRQARSNTFRRRQSSVSPDSSVAPITPITPASPCVIESSSGVNDEVSESEQDEINEVDDDEERGASYTKALSDELGRIQDPVWKCKQDTHWLEGLTSIGDDEKQSIRQFHQQQLQPISADLASDGDVTLQPSSHNAYTQTCLSSGELAEIEDELMRQEEERQEMESGVQNKYGQARQSNNEALWKYAMGNPARRDKVPNKSRKGQRKWQVRRYSSSNPSVSDDMDAPQSQPGPDYLIGRARIDDMEVHALQSRVADVQQHLSHIVHRQQQMASQWSEMLEHKEQQLVSLAELHLRHKEAVELSLRKTWTEQCLKNDAAVRYPYFRHPVPSDVSSSDGTEHSLDCTYNNSLTVNAAAVPTQYSSQAQLHPISENCSRMPELSSSSAAASSKRLPPIAPRAYRNLSVKHQQPLSELSSTAPIFYPNDDYSQTDGPRVGMGGISGVRGGGGAASVRRELQPTQARRTKPKGRRINKDK